MRPLVSRGNRDAEQPCLARVVQGLKLTGPRFHGSMRHFGSHPYTAAWFDQHGPCLGFDNTTKFQMDHMQHDSVERGALQPMS